MENMLLFVVSMATIFNFWLILYQKFSFVIGKYKNVIFN